MSFNKNLDHIFGYMKLLQSFTITQLDQLSSDYNNFKYWNIYYHQQRFQKKLHNVLLPAFFYFCTKVFLVNENIKAKSYL